MNAAEITQTGTEAVRTSSLAEVWKCITLQDAAAKSMSPP